MEESTRVYSTTPSLVNGEIVQHSGICESGQPCNRSRTWLECFKFNRMILVEFVVFVLVLMMMSGVELYFQTVNSGWSGVLHQIGKVIRKKQSYWEVNLGMFRNYVSDDELTKVYIDPTTALWLIVPSFFLCGVFIGIWVYYRRFTIAIFKDARFVILLSLWLSTGTHLSYHFLGCAILRSSNKDVIDDKYRNLIMADWTGYLLFQFVLVSKASWVLLTSRNLYFLFDNTQQRQEYNRRCVRTDFILRGLAAMSIWLYSLSLLPSVYSINFSVAVSLVAVAIGLMVFNFIFLVGFRRYWRRSNFFSRPSTANEELIFKISV